ncbi:MAG TPA: PKD domain-containing protein, partial [bacterium]|nr:PKD domain-containing protein [bacterium]
MPHPVPRLPLPLLVAGLLLPALGCQAKAPTVAEMSHVGSTAPVGLPLAAESAAVALAAFDLTIDASTGTAALAPTRVGQAIGDIYNEVGLMPAFNGRFGDHFRLDAVRRLDPETLALDFTTSHPFTPQVRPDLAIFNLKLWAAIDAPAVEVGGAQSVPGVVVNADGYGNMWATTATNLPPGPIHQPYVILHEDPSAPPFDWRNPSGWNVLFPGQSTTDTLEVRPGLGSTISVRLLLTADYGQSAVRTTRQNPQYELPQFAGNAPWKVQVMELSNTLQAGVTSSSADLRLDIWDWKHGQGEGSDVESALVSIPDLLGPTPVAPTLSGTGTEPTPLTASFVVPNTQGAPAGTYWGSVAVADSASGVAIMDDLTTLTSVGGYLTFQWFPLTVAEGPPVDPPAALVVRSCPGQPLMQGASESFDGSASTPGAAPIVDYEWDFNYAAPAFDVEATGAMVSHGFPSLGSYTVALRVRDTNGVEAIETTLVTVLPTAQWTPPTRLTVTAGQRELFDIYQNTSNALSVGPDGVVHLAYYTFLPYVVYHRSFQPSAPPVAWAAPEILHSSGGGGTGHVSCQTTSDNITHISYAANTNGNPRMYLNNSGGVWGTAVQIPS